MDIPYNNRSNRGPYSKKYTPERTLDINKNALQN